MAAGQNDSSAPLQNQEDTNSAGSSRPRNGFLRLLEIGAASAKLGLTSFGGPVAHLGYFRDEYVVKRKWLDERGYADLVALCQFLPGPASSQVGIGLGIIRSGLLGGVIAWLGFTLPSALAMALFALALQGMTVAQDGWLHGLKLVAVAIVAQAVLGMGRSLASDRPRATLAVAAAAVALLAPSAVTQVALIAAAGLFGAWRFRRAAEAPPEPVRVPVGRTAGAISLALFAALLVALPLLRQTAPGMGLALADSFYRAGALVFGGGHVVLPMLEREVVPAGWVSPETFLAGYGAAQAVPGPLFTFAAYLGAAAAGGAGAALATAAVFLPGFLLVVGALPFWNALRTHARMQGALTGINAAVVGLLLAALYDPIWTSAVRSPADFAAAAVLFGLLVFWKLPPWAVVLAGASAGWGLSLGLV